MAVTLECKESMLLKQRNWPWGLATETMCSQSVTVGCSSLQRLFDVSKAFKFNPGESQGYSSFDLRRNLMPFLTTTKCLRFKQSATSRESGVGESENQCYITLYKRYIKHTVLHINHVYILGYPFAESKIILARMEWKDIDMLLCREIISVHHWLHEAVTLNDCVALATLFSVLQGDNSMQSGHGIFHLLVYAAALLVVTVYDVNIRPFMYHFFCPPPSAPSSCYAAAGSLPKSSSFSSSKLLFYFASSFTSWKRNLTKCLPYMQPCWSPPPPPTPSLSLSLIRLLSDWATQLLHKS